MLCVVPVLRVVTPECFKEVGHLVPAFVTHILGESELFGVSIGRDVCVVKTVKRTIDTEVKRPKDSGLAHLETGVGVFVRLCL